MANGARVTEAGAGLPPPTAFGAPAKFGAWRDHQVRAVLEMADMETRVLVQVQPTGSGKSLCYVMGAVLRGGRTAILTSTKGLQDQIMADFGAALGIADVRGKNAYACLAVQGSRCDNAPCHIGYECSLKSSGCLYYDAVRRARRASIVVTNYAFWMASHQYGEGIGEFDTLVLDECHDAPEWVINGMRMELKREEMKRAGIDMLGLPSGDGANRVESWCAWARKLSATVEANIERVCDDARRRGGPHAVSSAVRTKVLAQFMQRLAKMDAGNWAVERAGPGAPMDVPIAVFEPVNPASYAEVMVLQGIDRVVMTSATVRPKTVDMLGIASGDRGVCTIVEYPSTFPVHRRPVIWVPTVRVNHRMTGAEEQLWLTRMDQVMGARSDRKGIIHTVSYARRNLIVSRSQHAERMMTHDSRNAAVAVDKFKRAAPPAVLISPSMTTGWDFPYDQCEYQIIAKIAFPDTRPAAIRARCERDPEFMSYVAMQTLVQACGRGMRAEDDACETIVVDNNWTWFMKQYGQRFAPKWFMDACKSSLVVPKPPPKLEMERE